jgi:hypothetical protein
MSILSFSSQDFPIAAAFAGCYDRYKELYIALVQEGQMKNEVPMSRLSDEYGRLGVWGKNSGADRTGRGSLDDVLRSDPSLRSIVLDLLWNFDADLKRGIF